MKQYDSIQELEFESNRLIQSYLEKAFYRSMTETDEPNDDVVSQQLQTLVEDVEPENFDFKNLMAFELKYDELASPLHEEVEQILMELQMMLESVISNVKYAYGDVENRQPLNKHIKPTSHEGPVPPKHFN
jgi:hypothetical protein